jgi:hypothetical protein
MLCLLDCVDFTYDFVGLGTGVTCVDCGPFFFRRWRLAFIRNRSRTGAFVNLRDAVDAPVLE